MDDAVVIAVRQRTAQRCEYCHLPADCSEAPFQIDHIIARKHSGPTAAGNLALTCFYCNSYKGPNIAGIDPRSGKIVRLFHPRRDRWHEHFRVERESGTILGLTSTGRATVAILQMNRPIQLAARRQWMLLGLFP